jgi:hypothetical protein
MAPSVTERTKKKQQPDPPLWPETLKSSEMYERMTVHYKLNRTSRMGQMGGKIYRREKVVC